MPGHTSESVTHGRPADQEVILLERVREGDTDAFGQLVQKYERAIYSLVSRMVRSKDEVDDLVQEIFLLAWRGIKNFRGEAQFGTWLHTIAVNATLKRLKALKKVELVSFDDPETGVANTLVQTEAPGPYQALCGKEAHAKVRQALNGLSEKHRMAVILYYFEDMPCEQIAQIMQCSVGTVWSRLHYACKKLKPQLLALDERTNYGKGGAARKGGDDQ